MSYSQQRYDDAIRHWEKAALLVETDINSTAMLLSCYVAVGNSEAARRIARIGISRAEKDLVQDPNNGAVTAYSAYALAALGDAERAKERIAAVATGGECQRPGRDGYPNWSNHAKSPARVQRFPRRLRVRG